MTPHQGGCPASGARGCGSHGQEPAVPLHVSQCGGSVPRYAQDGGQPRWDHHPVLPGGPEQDGRVASAVHADGSPGPEQHLAPDWRDHAAVEAGQIAPGPPHRAPASVPLGPSRKAVLNIILANNSNHCYANAVVVAVLWTAAQSPQGIAIANPALGRFLRWLTRPLQSQDSGNRAVELWSVRLWTDLVSQWQ